VDVRRPHIRVSTWRDLPGQDFVPDLPADLLAGAAEDVTVDIAGNATSGILVRLPASSWLLRVDAAPLHLLARGRGPVGDLSFEPLTDLEAAIDARRAVLAAWHPEE
jgi:hypothetical protein